MYAANVLCYVAIFAHICAVTLVSGLTNAEFYDVVKDFITDVEVLDPHNDSIAGGLKYGDEDVIEGILKYDDDDVITFRGGPDDEVDIEYIADKLGLTKLDKACVTVAYLPKNYGFEITFKINGRRVFHKELSLKHPPALCFGVPGLRGFARVCLQFYNINFRTKRICARLVGVLDLKFKKFRVHLKLGCFKIPILDEKALTSLLNDRDFLHVSAQASDDETEKAELQDLVGIYRQLQENEDII